MRLTRKLIIIGATGSALALILVLAGLWITHLLANRDTVKRYIAAKAAQATGAELVYDRLAIDFFPTPHVTVRGLRLHRAEHWDMRTEDLSVYPDILAALKGRFAIRRLDLGTPEFRVALAGKALGEKGRSQQPDARPVPEVVKKTLSSVFGAMAAIGNETTLEIDSGTIILSRGDSHRLHITGIDAFMQNDHGEISLALECASEQTGRLKLDCRANVDQMHADGRIIIAGINLGPLVKHADIPGGVTIDDTDTMIHATFTIDGDESVHSRFDLRFPSLTVHREDRELTLKTVSLTGTVGIVGHQWSLSVNHLQCNQPSLDLSVSASLTPPQTTDGAVIDIQAAAKTLEIEVAARVTRAIAGDLEGIRTAFAVAREGRLTDAAYHARFEHTDGGYRLSGMKATGHLSKGRVTIPGVEADLEQLDGDVVYQDRHVVFKDVSGYFQGASFEQLDAAIDWESASTLSIASPAVSVEANTFSNWLLAFEDLADMRNYITSANGTMRLTRLNIGGPLTRPAEWKFNVHGIPDNLELSSPLLPFAPRFDGGLVVYDPGSEAVMDVVVEFLDGSLVASYQPEGIFKPSSIACRLDGSLGPRAIAWLTDLLPVPDHLQLKPPVTFSGLHIDWSDNGSAAVKGSMQTAGNVSLSADINRGPTAWDIRRIEFSDGLSRAVASGRMTEGRIEVAFAGNVEKATADRILADNRSLTGRINGDFQAVIDTHRPAHSTFIGHLSGQGLQIHQLLPETIDLQHFSIQGRDQRLTIASSEIELYGSRLTVDGSLAHHSGDVALDLNVDADRLDVELIQAIQAVGGRPAGAAAEGEQTPPAAYAGSIRVHTKELAYDKWVWSSVDAVVKMAPDAIRVNVNAADLCGIATVGELEFSPRGRRLHITPRAEAAPLAETVDCLFNKPIRAEARYDLTGDIRLPAGQHEPLMFMTGNVSLSSTHGRIHYSNVLMKVLSVLNLTEVFAGGESDLAEKGYGYTAAQVKTEIGGGNLYFKEILLDGNSLKISGQGSIDLKSRDVDIVLLAAPLKTVDRLVKKIPVISRITGGSLVSIPLHLEGTLDNVSVSTMSPSAVGKGMLNMMGRMLKAPFELVEGSERQKSERAAE